MSPVPVANARLSEEIYSALLEIPELDNSHITKITNARHVSLKIRDIDKSISIQAIQTLGEFLSREEIDTLKVRIDEQTALQAELTFSQLWPTSEANPKTSSSDSH